MATYAFRILNVFAESTLGGNPLCVFENGEGLDDATMQALALQFNLSETTFLFSPDGGTASVRIFTTGYEMRFAGHPTLGSAHVLRSLTGLDQVTLVMQAGSVPVAAKGDVWTLTAPTSGPPKVKLPDVPADQIAAMVGLCEDDLLVAPQWIDTGTDQLMIPLKSVDAVRRAAPDTARIGEWPLSSLNRKTAYVFAFDAAEPSQVVCRYFFSQRRRRGGGRPGYGIGLRESGWLADHAKQAAPGELPA
jgi:PhzF family phenazine biosynthesis protein